MSTSKRDTLEHLTNKKPNKKQKQAKSDTLSIRDKSSEALDENEKDRSIIKEPQSDKTISLMDWLCQLRKLRTNATSAHDLIKVIRDLKRLIAKAEQIGDDQIWNDAGLFLATLLLQQDSAQQTSKDKQLISKLLYDRGFLYRLSRAALTQCHQIIHAQNPITIPNTNANTNANTNSKRQKRNNNIAAMAWDHVLPNQLLHSMQQAFSKSSHFWSAHDYSDGSAGTDPSPYFSYIVPLQPNNHSHHHSQKKQTVLVQVIHILRHLVSQAFPQVMEECTAAEWWCHNRPHSSGHQLHFDSDDEGRGGVRNPICSTVLYLTPNHDTTDTELHVGGETLLTTQSSTGTKLSETADGWLCSSKTNRLLTFAGNLLHGVVPGAGVGPNTDHHRITFMVAFWKKIRIQDDKAHHGSARSFFGRVDQEEWAQQLSQEVDTKFETQPNKLTCLSKQCFYQVPVWEDINKQRNDKYKESLAHARKQRYLPPYDVFFQFYG